MVNDGTINRVVGYFLRKVKPAGEGQLQYPFWALGQLGYKDDRASGERLAADMFALNISSIEHPASTSRDKRTAELVDNLERDVLSYTRAPDRCSSIDNFARQTTHLERFTKLHHFIG